MGGSQSIERMPNWRQQALEIFLKVKFRPWALLTPLLVLLVAIPLLRPLRLPGGATSSERLLLDTVESLSTRGGMALDPTTWRGRPGTTQHKGRTIADRPPVYSVLLAGPAWVMLKSGLDWDEHAETMAFLLTLFGSTIPVAVGGGVIYRMGRLFELTRPKRALLALLVTFGGGWISYATVLNPHAPAAAALVCAAACLLFVAAAKKSANALPICLLAGLCSSMACAISPWTMPLAIPLPLVLFAMQIPTKQKIVGFILMTIGAAPIAWIHTGWSLDSFGSIIAPGSVATLQDVVAADPEESPVLRVGSLGASLFNVTLGNHGVLTHFPILIAGLIGLFIVLRKHWPMHAKMLAAISFVGATTIVMIVAARHGSVGGWMFGVQWFVVFLPLICFWMGAVMRREMSKRGGWILASACAISVLVSIAGALQPLPVVPYRSNTAIGAMQRWVGSEAAVQEVGEPMPLTMKQ